MLLVRELIRDHGYVRFEINSRRVRGGSHGRVVLPNRIILELDRLQSCKVAHPIGGVQHHASDGVECEVFGCWGNKERQAVDKKWQLVARMWSSCAGKAPKARRDFGSEFSWRCFRFRRQSLFTSLAVAREAERRSDCAHPTLLARGGALSDAMSSILTKREDDAHFSGREVNVQDRIQVGDIGQEKISGWLLRLCVFETASAQIQMDFALVPGYFNRSSGVHGFDEPDHMHSDLFEPRYAAEAYAHSCRFVFPFPE